MADLAQFRKRHKKPVEIDPDLKVFIDCVIVPILVKEYPEMSDGDNVLAHEGSDTAHFVSSTAAPAPGREKSCGCCAMHFKVQAFLERLHSARYARQPGFSFRTSILTTGAGHLRRRYSRGTLDFLSRLLVTVLQLRVAGY
jgi:hypothetical protein